MYMCSNISLFICTYVQLKATGVGWTVAGLNVPGTMRWPPAEVIVANFRIWTITVLSSPAFDGETRYPCEQGPKGQFLGHFPENFNPTRDGALKRKRYWSRHRDSVRTVQMYLCSDGLLNISTSEHNLWPRLKIALKGGDHQCGDVRPFLGCHHSQPVMKVCWYQAVELCRFSGCRLIHEGRRALFLTSPGLPVHGHCIISRFHRA